MHATEYEVETTFINAWVETGAYELEVSAEMTAKLGRSRLDLLDVNFVLKTGHVVNSDMLGSRGLWDVLGRNVDGVLLLLRVAVVSAACQVELLRVDRMKRSGR